MSTKDLIVELEVVRNASGDGILRSADVVNYARTHEESVLHSHFDWDDEVAGEKWRLQQASDLIRATVKYLGDGPRTVRCYVSLEADRKAGGGYRHIDDVARDDALREQMLAEARRDANAFVAKYQTLEEYAEAIAAMKRAAG